MGDHLLPSGLLRPSEVTQARALQAGARRAFAAALDGFDAHGKPTEQGAALIAQAAGYMKRIRETA